MRNGGGGRKGVPWGKGAAYRIDGLGELNAFKTTILRGRRGRGGRSQEATVGERFLDGTKILGVRGGEWLGVLTTGEKHLGGRS